jgi:hypothetical protein
MSGSEKPNQTQRDHMKRIGILAVVVLSLVAIFGSTALAARPAASFVARAGTAEQGGSLHVRAKVKHAVRTNTFSASAVVHFASGDVSVTLKRHGRSYTANGRVPVAADETLGPVSVDVTIEYGGTTQTLTVEGTIVPPEDEDEDAGEDGGEI